MQKFSLPLQKLGLLQGRLSRGEEIQRLSLFKFNNTPLSSERGVFLCLDSGLDSEYSGVLFRF